MHQPVAPATAYRPGFREFVALMAGLMALNAIAIDAMVPALPAIGEALGVADENRRQLVVSAYVFGFGAAQIIFGPLSDRFGRKPVLVISLILYVIAAMACAAASSFSLLLVARACQGGAAAATRVLVASIVRDRYEGAAMARIMSLAFLVFMLMPVMAPIFGQLTLMVASWRTIFFGLALFAAIMFAWSVLRLPETLRPEYRRPLSFRSVYEGTRETLTNRQSLGYMLAFTMMMGALMSYINSVQQIVFDVFHRPELVALTFAGVAGPMAITSYLNSRLVERAGAKRMAHIGLTGFTILALLHLGTQAQESLLLFVVMQGLTMAFFGLSSANLGALALQPLGHVAGTASSVQGAVSTVGGALLGLAVGQSFDGTTGPLVTGFVLFGLTALAILLVTENGRLFRDTA